MFFSLASVSISTLVGVSEKLLKIMHVMAGAGQGGAETFFVDAIGALRQADFEQCVVVRPGNIERVEAIKKLNILLKTASFGQHWK